MAAAEVVVTAGKVATAVADMVAAATAVVDMAPAEAATAVVVVAMAVEAGAKVAVEATETASARVAGEVAVAETLAPATATATVGDQCVEDQEATRSVPLARMVMAAQVATGDKHSLIMFLTGGWQESFERAEQPGLGSAAWSELARQPASPGLELCQQQLRQ